MLESYHAQATYETNYTDASGSMLFVQLINAGAPKNLSDGVHNQLKPHLHASMLFVQQVNALAHMNVCIIITARNSIY